ncbi:MAG TPA: endonuclease III domain-containing protein [Pirellulales bacterium]|nr:endonuclease III domain-containing protein [Pirellulales bacterium]
MGSSNLHRAFELLAAHYGPQRPAPADGPLESLLSALLGDGASHAKAEQALHNLSEAGLLNVRRLAVLPIDELAELIQPAGDARKNAARVQRVLQYVVQRWQGELDAMFETDAETLREELLAERGVGAATVDAILLLACRRPGFIADLAAHRVLKRHDWVELEADGYALKEYVESGLDRDPDQLVEFHFLLERVGREHCRKTPLCDGCPLAELLPSGGPLGSEY